MNKKYQAEWKISDNYNIKEIIPGVISITPKSLKLEDTTIDDDLVEVSDNILLYGFILVAGIFLMVWYFFGIPEPTKELLYKIISWVTT
jgi:hypothetical protein